MPLLDWQCQTFLSHLSGKLLLLVCSLLNVIPQVSCYGQIPNHKTNVSYYLTEKQLPDILCIYLEYALIFFQGGGGVNVYKIKLKGLLIMVSLKINKMIFSLIFRSIMFQRCNRKTPKLRVALHHLNWQTSQF